MSRLGDPLEVTLPEWVGDALREPVISRPAARARIMDVIRGMPTPRRFTAPIRRSRWLRRGLLSPVGGVMTTAVLALVVVLRAGTGGGINDIVAVSRILGDSVVPLHDTSYVAGASRWLDTMRIVEFVIRGSSVHSAAVLGDFNRWQRGATPLAAAGHHEWRARVLVPRDALDVAYLVNGTQFIPAAPLEHPLRIIPDTSPRSGRRTAG